MIWTSYEPMYVNRLFLKKINRDFICIFIIYLSQKLQLARKIKYFVKSVSKTTHWHLIGKGNTTERSHEPILLPSSTFFCTSYTFSRPLTGLVAIDFRLYINCDPKSGFYYSVGKVGEQNSSSDMYLLLSCF